MQDNIPIFGGGLERATRPTNSKGHNFSTIQAAIDDMDVAGWIYAPPGTYNEAVDINAKNNLMLYGAGWGATKITYAGNDHALDIDNSDDVITRDLRIDQTSTGNSVNAIRLDDAQRCKIQNVYIGNSDEHGIAFMDAPSTNCEISGCHIIGVDAHGIYVYRGTYNIIKGNICRDNLLDGIKIYGTVGNLVDYNILRGNICKGNGGKGIYIFGDKGSGNDYANKNIVVGNQLYNNTGVNLDDDGTATELGHNITA